MAGIPESIGSGHVTLVPLELVNEDGLAVMVMTEAASVPVAMPGIAGDILSVLNEGPGSLRFRVGGPADYATAASNPVTVGNKEVFAVAANGTQTHISFLAIGAPAGAVVNWYRRGT